ncbi:unnamed protein product [marine sediment metagenome]|uniref:Uncharacterized protein n=1 Tax=marine sediment metagenome TaxID=412755 RepID=X0VTD4_9ZZZZ
MISVRRELIVNKDAVNGVPLKWEQIGMLISIASIANQLERG